ncbi:hypothetical protein [Phytohabitans kaempferiae]|uniref:WXG100 family type VII secretion target n=1 Tax=Phytohabitans kaempferiae TaxID=1620943 RepID=A0ABV6M921_9ACTN
MADETGIDPDGALRMFSQLSGIGQDIDAALSRVVNIRSTVVEPWGNDEYGRPFGGQREQNALDALDGVGVVVEGLTDLSKVGRDAINEFVKLDGENGQRLGPDN